jgi:hypothetical protein
LHQAIFQFPFSRRPILHPCRFSGEVAVNTKIWHRKESELWARLGEKIHPEEGRFLQKDSAKELAVGSWLPFDKETVCADFAGLRDDVARAKVTNGWISDRT